MRSDLPDSSTTSLILSSITELKDRPGFKTKVSDIGSKGSDFLLSEKNLSWSWNYWQRKSKETSTMPYPDDLDDTFCALSTLSLYKKEVLTGEVLSSITKILTQNEGKVGGPYYTWIVDQKGRPQWQDIDVAVNANIAYFLSLCEIDLPNITELIENSIRERNFKSLYYHSPYPIFYFISRAYRGPLRKSLSDHILEKQDKDGLWGDMLSTSLAVSSLINLNNGKSDDNLKIDKALVYLVQTAMDEYWPPLPMYIEENKGEALYSGSSALTAAFCIEAIGKYERFLQKTAEERISGRSKDTKNSKRIKDQILLKVERRFQDLSSSLLSEPLLDLMRNIAAKGPGDEIMLLPYFFRESLVAGGKNISDTSVIDLGIANLFGWMAYKLYDDVLDEEGDLSHIPCANICLRELAGVYIGLFPKKTRLVFDSMMDDLESANIWERKSCYLGKNRLDEPINIPDYKDHEVLAQKSLPHALGPINILTSLGYDILSPQVSETISFFRHYLIARQLNDDAHDWPSDLERGFLNSVSAQLFRDHESVSQNKGKLELQKTFWDKTVLRVLGDMSRHVALAKTSLRKNGIVKDTTYFDSLLFPIEQAIEKTAFERTRMKEFLNSY